jgi:hypothetical protein
MNLTTEQKMMLITLYLMGTTLGSFEAFCEAVNGFEKEEIEKAFDSLEMADMENFILTTDKLLAEMTSAKDELCKYWEKKNAQVEE